MAYEGKELLGSFWSAAAILHVTQIIHNLLQPWSYILRRNQRPLQSSKLAATELVTLENLFLMRKKLQDRQQQWEAASWQPKGLCVCKEPV
jgi:hypothetical protein